MGWWSDHKAKGISFDAWAKKKYFRDDKSFQHEVIATGLVNRSVLYMACKRTVKATKESYVYGMIVLIQWVNDPYQNMMVKEIDETCGPNEYHCPKKVFIKLSPLPDLGLFGINLKYATEWRQAVTDYHAKCDSWKAVKNGDDITIKEEIVFTGGWHLTQFTVKDKRKNLYTPRQHSQWNTVKIPKHTLLHKGYMLG